jgi:hypothetical protein
MRWSDCTLMLIRKKNPDASYFDIVRNLFEYIIENKIIIPIIDENEDTAQNTKKKEAQIKCRPKQKKNCRFSP